MSFCGTATKRKRRCSRENGFCTNFLLAHCGGGQEQPGCIGPSAEHPGSSFRAVPLVVLPCNDHLPETSEFVGAALGRPLGFPAENRKSEKINLTKEERRPSRCSLYALGQPKEGGLKPLQIRLPSPDQSDACDCFPGDACTSGQAISTSSLGEYGVDLVEARISRASLCR